MSCYEKESTCLEYGIGAKKDRTRMVNTHWGGVVEDYLFDEPNVDTNEVIGEIWINFRIIMLVGKMNWLKGLGITLFCIVCGGCSENKELYKDPSQPIAKRVENLIDQMTLQEKVAQMCQYVGPKHMKTAEQNLSVEDMQKIPLLIGIDAIHGNALCSGVTVYQTPIGQASTFDVELVSRRNVW